jgi:hypothetical protein
VLVAAAGVLWWVRRAWTRYFLVLAALAYLLCFAGIQAVSFHIVDALLRHPYAGISLKTWGNLAGLALAVVAVLPFLKPARPRPISPPLR